MPDKPLISMVIVAYEMARELPRTLRTALPPYQKGIESGDVEVIVVDNGSREPLSRSQIEAFPGVTLKIMEAANPSPVAAIHAGAQLARGEWLGILVDGARMLSPGILEKVLLAGKLDPDPFVSTVACHLGSTLQQISTREGYNQSVEDELLASIAWEEDGYKLFSISTLAASSANGWFGPISESNAVFLKRESYFGMGGFDPAFQTPGGGYCNLDFYKRAVERFGKSHIQLLGEATFHQVHGGVSTNHLSGQISMGNSAIFREEYLRIRGAAYQQPTDVPILLGQAFPECRATMKHALDSVLSRDRGR